MERGKDDEADYEDCIVGQNRLLSILAGNSFVNVLILFNKGLVK